MLTIENISIPSTTLRLLPLGLTCIVQYWPKLMFVISFWIASAVALQVLSLCQLKSDHLVKISLTIPTNPETFQQPVACHIDK